jgi:hypothetical protein
MGYFLKTLTASQGLSFPVSRMLVLRDFQSAGSRLKNSIPESEDSLHLSPDFAEVPSAESVLEM